MKNPIINQLSIDPLIRDDLSFFTHKAFNTVSPSSIYKNNWHVDLMSEYLMACKNGEIKRLIINIPPRFMKSISVSVAFPAWLLGQNPKTQIMCASYGMALSHKHSMDSRLLIESEWYKRIFPRTKLVEDQNTKSKFVTTERGFRLATSIGSAVTGSGADFLIIDDPLNADGANSETTREAANTWYDQVFSTRLNDRKEGCIILVMQRLHENDLSGHLLAKGGWENLSIPLIAECDTEYSRGKIKIKREMGNILHEQRLGEREIKQLKAELGPYAFAGQYQQRPSPAGGGEFRKEWIQYYDSIDHSTLNKYIFVDPANSKHKKSDYTAMFVIGVGQDKNVYILDMVRDRLDVKGREDMLFSLHQKYRPLGVAYEKYGMQVDSDWIRYAQERRNYRFPITDVGGTMDKEGRIRRLQSMFANSRMWFPRALFKNNHENNVIDLVNEFIIQEYVPFPVGVHDDMMDCLSRMMDITLQYPGNAGFDYHKFAAGFTSY